MPMWVKEAARSILAGLGTWKTCGFDEVICTSWIKVHKWGYPKNGRFIMENAMKLDDFGVVTPNSGHAHVYLLIIVCKKAILLRD